MLAVIFACGSGVARSVGSGDAFLSALSGNLQRSSFEFVCDVKNQFRVEGYRYASRSERSAIHSPVWWRTSELMVESSRLFDPLR
jgi:hypothetical protein